VTGEGHRQAGVGVPVVDGRVGEQHMVGVGLVGGSTRSRSGRGKLTSAGCSVADRVGGERLVSAPEELLRVTPDF
jgi:hypothetical protein